MITKTTKSLDTVLAELRQMNAVLHKQTQEIASLREMAAVQFRRIADLQAELDLLPAARKRRETVRALLQPSASPNGRNGNGRTG